MRVEIIRSQSDSLMEWAAMWEADPASGSNEVGFLLRRAARLMKGQVDDAEPNAPLQIEHVVAD